MPWFYEQAALAITLLWLAFFLIWLIAAFTAKRARYRQPLHQRLAYFAVGTVSSLLIQFVPALRIFLLPIRVEFCATGLLLSALGIAFAVWARFHLGRNWSGFVQIKQDHQLIQSGPYGLVRHPIYTGLLLAIAGSFLALFPTLGGIVTLLALTGAFVIKIRQEESLMLQEFPTRYPDYKSRVRSRLVPFIL